MRITRIPKQMNIGLQTHSVRRALAEEGIDTEMFDVEAHMDRTLSLPENLENIKRIHGIGRSIDQEVERHQGLFKRGADLPIFRQVGSSDFRRDELLPAEPPGRRAAIPGRRKRYYEYRKNRSDMPGRRT